MFRSVLTALKPSSTQTDVIGYSAALAQRLNAELNYCIIFDVNQIGPCESVAPQCGHY